MMRDAKKDLEMANVPIMLATDYCNGEMRVALRYWIKRAEKAEAAVEVAEAAHELCIDELMEAQEENKKLRDVLFCKEPWCRGGEILMAVDRGNKHFAPCPTCGPLRAELRGEG